MIGTIKHSSALTTVWTQELLKHTLVIEEQTDSEYPQSVIVDFYWDKTEWSKKMRAWDVVDVEFNLKAKEYQKDNETRYFQTISWYKIKKIEQVTDDQNLPF